MWSAHGRRLVRRGSVAPGYVIRLGEKLLQLVPRGLHDGHGQN